MDWFHVWHANLLQQGIQYMNRFWELLSNIDFVIINHEAGGIIHLVASICPFALSFTVCLYSQTSLIRPHWFLETFGQIIK